MARVSYTALRSLQGGVTVNDTINFDFNVSKLDRETKPVRGESISLGGDQETVRERTDVLFAVGIVPVLEAEFDDFRQFLDSCDGGEEFTFDPYGTFASPIAAQTCVLSSKGYKEKRVSERYLSTSFKVRVTS